MDTFCLRFRRLLSPVWTGLNDVLLLFHARCSLSTPFNFLSASEHTVTHAYTHTQAYVLLW